MRPTLHSSSSRADRQSLRAPVRSQPSSTDTDEYDSFDEEELEILNGILEAHELPLQTENALPPSPPLYPLLPKLSADFSDSKIPYTSIQTSVSTLTAVIRQSDNPEGVENLRDVEEVEHGSQIPRLRHQSPPSITRGAILEVRYEGGVQLRTTDEPQLRDVPPLRTEESPFNRFRGTRRGLSVTDLLSSTWCEQQFEYYLVRGIKKKSPAMKAGTKIHKKLEREVHDEVQVSPRTAEDRMGLKLLNIIQGLRALREQGMTRELPVFAIMKGMFIQGVIDEITYHKPVDKVYGALDKEPNTDTAEVDSQNQQPVMTSFLTSTTSKPQAKVAYICDNKTRSRDSLPSASQFRGTVLQLMLYRFLLNTMASSVAAATRVFSNSGIGPNPSSNATSGTTPDDSHFSRLFEARKLDPYAKFTDDFIASIAPTLDEGDSEDADTPIDLNSPAMVNFPNFTHITNNPTLSGLLDLLNISFSTTIPSISNTMSVSYRSQQTDRLLATKTVEYNEKLMGLHVDNVLQWWKGERDTVGVSIEEAWKCKSCEFADECVWRMQKLAELDEEREKVKAATKTGKGKKKASK